MAATLTYLTQRALSSYTFMSVDHPLYEAWLEYQRAKALRDGIRPAKARLKAELYIERLIADEMERAA